MFPELERRLEALRLVLDDARQGSLSAIAPDNKPTKYCWPCEKSESE